MYEIGSAVIGGMAASTGAEMLHNDVTKKSVEEYLEQLCHLVENASRYLKEKPANTKEEHITTYVFLDHSIPIRFKDYLAVYVLVPSTSTFTITVSGLGSFVWTPTVGVYNRWRYPEGATIQLLTPNNTGNTFPIDILYTYDISQ